MYTYKNIGKMTYLGVIIAVFTLFIEITPHSREDELHPFTTFIW